MLGVDEQDAGADRLRRFKATEDDVLNDRLPETRALVLSADGEPGEQDRRDRASSRLALERSPCRFVRCSLGSREHIVASDRLAVVERDTEHTG
jgi:hypothetical protein